MIKKYSLILVLVHSISCRHQIQIESIPSGATIEYKGEELGTTPLELGFWWAPFRPYPLTVHLNGYRSFEFQAGRSLSVRTITQDIIRFRWKRLIGTETRSSYRLQLIREHGPAGTWNPEEATH